jgi:hypothetical protein
MCKKKCQVVSVPGFNTLRYFYLRFCPFKGAGCILPLTRRDLKKNGRHRLTAWLSTPLFPLGTTIFKPFYFTGILIIVEPPVTAEGITPFHLLIAFSFRI